jgi:hypothetical protein
MICRPCAISTRGRRAAGWARALGAAGVAFLLGAGPAAGNGDTQREVQGRVVSVDAGRGSIVVERQFRGKVTRVTLQARPGTRVFDCGEERASLERVKAGMVVSVFYEVVGSTEGVVNLVVLERGR